MTEYHSYTPADGHGLKYNPFKALIAPRPIGWISTRSPAGDINLAPYSFFNALCELPPMVGFISNLRKHSLENIEATGAFVHNVCPGALAREMNRTSALYERGINEFEKAGLTAIESDVVDAPRVAEAPAAMECKLIEIKRLADLDGAETNCWLTIGQVVRIHIRSDFIKDGMVDEAQMALLARLGYRNYAKVETVFSMERPAAD